MAGFYTFNRVAEILDISRPTLLAMIRKNEIIAIKIGKTWRIPKEEIERLKKGE